MCVRRILLSVLIGTALSVSMVKSAMAEPKVLRIVPQADLKILDPIWTSAFVTRTHGYMIYDTLFGVDEKGVVRPQMVDTYDISQDGKSFRFTLRDGLSFHDGAPVTADDVIASLKRWSARDSLGQRMFAQLESITATDAKSVTMVFKTPFSMVLEALGKPSSVPPFIMPQRVAATPPDQQISEAIGSGPYKFIKSEYRPGERVVYVKNEAYRPRNEPPSGTAGGKKVFVDRLEWVILKDGQTQANALTNGEVDLIEWLPNEQYMSLKANPDIKMMNQVVKMQVSLHLNHLIPPFDNPKIAQAALLAVNQTALLRAQIVNKELFDDCVSMYPCGTAFSSNDTGYYTGKAQFEKAKALLKEANYNGTPVALMLPADFPTINKYPTVMAELLRQAGFKVDLQSMDWATLVSRRAKMDPVANGGWNAFITSWGVGETMNPMFFAPLTGNGTKGWYGWATDPELEKLKDDFVAAPDMAARTTIAHSIQQRVFASAIYAPLGEFKPVTAFRSSVSGIVQGPVWVYWNIDKK